MQRNLVFIFFAFCASTLCLPLNAAIGADFIFGGVCLFCKFKADDIEYQANLTKCLCMEHLVDDIALLSILKDIYTYRRSIHHDKRRMKKVLATSTLLRTLNERYSSDYTDNTHVALMWSYQECVTKVYNGRDDDHDFRYWVKQLEEVTNLYIQYKYAVLNSEDDRIFAIYRMLRVLPVAKVCSKYTHYELK